MVSQGDVGVMLGLLLVLLTRVLGPDTYNTLDPEP